MRKQHHYGLGRIYEMVINNDPCYAYLQEIQQLVDQKLVMAHVYGHCDFFKNNLWFTQTNRKMMDEMANHATRIRKHIEKRARIGRAMAGHLPESRASDRSAPHVRKRGPRKTPATRRPGARSRSPVQSQGLPGTLDQPPGRAGGRGKKTSRRGATRCAISRPRIRRTMCSNTCSTRPAGGLAGGISRDHPRRSLLLAPQGMTKVMNEGWACCSVGDALVFTDRGLMPMRDIVEGELSHCR